MSYEPYPTQPDPGQPIPPAPPYPQYPALYQPVKSLTATGTLSVAAAGLVTLMTLVNAIAVGPAVRAGEIGGWFVAYGLAAVGHFVLLVGGFVASSMWLYQARRNTEAFAPEWSHTRSAGWAWGGWVCPVVSLWFPFQVVRDVFQASARTRTSSSLIGWWWAFWVVILFLDRISSNVEDDALTSGSASGAQGLAWFTFVVTAAGAVLWGFVVHRITALQGEWMRGTPPA